MRTILTFLLIYFFYQSTYFQNNHTINDSLKMQIANKEADSKFLFMNAGDSSKLKHNNTTTWIYDGQGNVIGGSKIKKGPMKSVKLIDSLSNNYFILDSAHIRITAYDKSGKMIWSTDPYYDNSIREYRTKRPVIVQFGFHICSFDFPDFAKKGQKVICITYNNTQFGLVDLKKGKYYWLGQD